MPVAEATRYRFNPFDLTKVWHYADYPLIDVGRLTLNRSPENYFADPTYAGIDVTGATGSYRWSRHPADDDFVQAAICIG